MAIGNLHLFVVKVLPIVLLQKKHIENGCDVCLQFFCLVRSCSCPTTDENPCMCTFLPFCSLVRGDDFLSLHVVVFLMGKPGVLLPNSFQFPKLGCCTTIGNLKGKAIPETAPLITK